MCEPKVCKVCERSIRQARIESLPDCERCTACQKSFDTICQKYGREIAENVEEYGKLLILEPSFQKCFAGEAAIQTVAVIRRANERQGIAGPLHERTLATGAGGRLRPSEEFQDFFAEERFFLAFWYAVMI